MHYHITKHTLIFYFEMLHIVYCAMLVVKQKIKFTCVFINLNQFFNNIILLNLIYTSKCLNNINEISCLTPNILQEYLASHYFNYNFLKLLKVAVLPKLYWNLLINEC